MVVGFNHNVHYQGALYHVQTEDGGLKKPHIITHLYRAGSILSTKRVSYADITRVDGLPRVVEDLMKEQHKEMLRELKNGEFDALIAERFSESCRPSGPSSQDEPPLPAEDLPRAVEVPRESVARATTDFLEEIPSPAPEPDAAKELSLDDLVLSYLTGGREE